jgi:uncharacterized protein (TIGR01777 family)
LQMRRMRIVLPGGSGLLGQVLARHFQEQGHHVTVLTRGPYAAAWQTVHWDPERDGAGQWLDAPWIATLEGADVCINLAGRSVNCRFTRENCAEVYNSRIGTTRLLGQAMARLSEPPRVWLNASTATIYRHSRPGIDGEMDEATGELGGGELVAGKRRAPKTWNLSVQVAKDWEAAFFELPLPRTRRVALRAAMVMSPEPGSAFGILSNLVRVGLGGRQGSGEQFVSWIHEYDFVRAVEFLIEHEEMEGAVNLAAPHPLPNWEFMAALREAWDMPNGLPAPAWLLEAAAFVMRTESELVLKSRRVVPGRLLEAGFGFEYPRWDLAAEELVKEWRRKR